MSALTFKVLGSGFQVFAEDGDLSLGVIDKQVDGFYCWIPNTAREDARYLVLSGFVLRQIWIKIEQLNYVEECNQLSARLTPERAKKLKAVYDLEDQKPYTIEELEATKFAGLSVDNSPKTIH